MKNRLFLIMVLFLLGCKDEYKECIKTPPDLYTAGYDSASIDTILIFGYEKGGNFSKKLNEDSFIFSRVLTRKINEDSFFINSPLLESYRREYENFDWIYVIPATGDKFKVTEVKRKTNKTTIDHPNSACTSPIISLRLNGTLVEFQEVIQQPLWITKP